MERSFEIDIKNCKRPDCKKEFSPNSGRQVYCSKGCRQRERYIRRMLAGDPWMTDKANMIRKSKLKKQ